MTSCSCALLHADPNFCFPAKNPCSSSLAAATAGGFRLQSRQMGCVVLPRSRKQEFRVWANANASRGKEFSSDVVLMVDPLEAKRLAAKQMQEIQAKQKLEMFVVFFFLQPPFLFTVDFPMVGALGFSLVLAKRIVGPCAADCHRILSVSLTYNRSFSQNILNISEDQTRKQRQIEAINGAWAMIGLTAGLVIEGQTGESILGQFAGYLSAIAGFFSL